MENWKKIVSHKHFRYLDHSNKNFLHQKPFTALTSFAVDDVLAQFVGNGESSPAVRLWVHPDTVVLGIPDARLPYVEEGVHLLAEQGYHVVVRNSGGLAVALDSGVLNISLILPNVKHLSIQACYEAMVSFVQYMLRDVTQAIQAYEITGSYCPGDYDLSIDGKKFAGISQRRVKDGAAVQIYLDVEGKGEERAQLIRAFYRVARKNEATKFEYPEVDPNVMASLSEVLGIELRVGEVKDRVWNTLSDLSESIWKDDFSEAELEQFKKRYQQMVKRNEEIARLQ